MTNGEKIKEIFPNIIKYGNILIDDTGALQKNILFDDTWWNAEYKEHKSEAKIDCIDRAELLKAMDTWNKFGNVPYEGLIRLSTPALQDIHVAYVKYDDMVNCVKGLPSVTPQEPRKGHWILTDVEGNKVWHCHCSECGEDPQYYVGGSENWCFSHRKG